MSAPCVGSVTMVKFVTGPSTSEPVSTMGNEESSGVVTLWLFARGRSFTGVTVMLTVAMLDVSEPSLTVNVNESGPL